MSEVPKPLRARATSSLVERLCGLVAIALATRWDR